MSSLTDFHGFLGYLGNSVIVLALVVALPLTTLIYHLRPKKHVSPEEKPPIPEKSPRRLGANPPREWGKWVSSDFKRPKAAPYPGWDIKTTKPLPYRPFRWGPYHITMGIRSMPWDEWIELDNRFLEYHSLRAARLTERGERACRTAPQAMPAAIEMLEELADYLPERYPSLYRRTAVGLDNLVTGESFDVVTRPLSEDPMAMASRLVQDDLAIMIEGSDGQYYLLSAAILLAGFWRLEDKFGQSIAEIHSAGRGVPGFRTKLQKGMENFFKRVTPDKPVIRHNYFVQVDDKLAWSSSIGSEDGAGDDGFGWFNAEENKAIEHHHFRTERQTLRRLPKSGGVVFTIRTYFEKMTDIAQEPGVPGRLASALRSWDEEVSRYKGKSNYGEILVEYLEGKHQEQLKQGIVSDVGDHEVYPY